jgi:SH3-like domain-containing protein
MKFRAILSCAALAVVVLTSGPCLAERLAVVGSRGNVRSGPATTYEVLWQVEENYPLEVLRREGEWCFFKDFEGDEGWVHQSLLGKVRTVVTRRDNCNIRSGPGSRFDVLFTVGKGVPFKVLQSDGDWLQIAHADGDQGWIHRSLAW